MATLLFISVLVTTLVYMSYMAKARKEVDRLRAELERTEKELVWAKIMFDSRAKAFDYAIHREGEEVAERIYQESGYISECGRWIKQ